MSNPLGPSEDFNPYSAPNANLDAVQPGELTGDLAEAESIRRQFLKHEASVKSIGSLYYLGSVFTLCFCIFVGSQLVSNPQAVGLLTVGSLGISGVLVLATFATGYGLTTLKPWARWMAVGLNTLNFLSVAFQAILTASNPNVARELRRITLLGSWTSILIITYIYYLLISKKSTFVFSQPYREIIRLTPHVKRKWGCIIKLGIGFFVSLIVLVIVAALFGR